MQVFRGFHHPRLAPACALTIGNFDGVHRGHQAMLALLKNEAQHRGLPACVVTFEPHPRAYFAPEQAPPRIATLRDKLSALARCGIDQTVVVPFNAALAKKTAQAFIDEVLVQGLGARYVLVGDDFRFGAGRQGDYALLDAQTAFEVARMNSYEVHGLRISSSKVRQALAQGDMKTATQLLGRPYSISGHVVHGRKLGRDLGFRTLNIPFHARRCAAEGIFVVQVTGLSDTPLPGVANLGSRPTVDNTGQIWLEVHCLDWPPHLGPEGAYGKIARVELLHKLHDERHYSSLQALRDGIAQDCDDARAFFASTHV